MDLVALYGLGVRKEFTLLSPELFPTTIEFGNMRKNFAYFLILGGNKKVIKSIFSGFAIPWFRDKDGNQIMVPRLFYQNKLKSKADKTMWNVIVDEPNQGMWTNIPNHTPWLTEPMFNDQKVKPNGKIKNRIISSVKITNCFQPKMSTTLITERNILEIIDQDGVGMTVYGKVFFSVIPLRSHDRAFFEASFLKPDGNEETICSPAIPMGCRNGTFFTCRITLIVA